MPKPKPQEILTALKAVRAAKEQVRALRTPEYPLGSELRELIETAFLILDEIEGDLLLQQLEGAVSELEADGKSLQSLANKMQQSIAGLEAIAQGIATAAKAIQVVVDIIQKAAAL